MKKTITPILPLASALLIALTQFSAKAQALTAFEIAERSLTQSETVGFEGQKQLSVSRLNSGPQTATANIRYVNRRNYSIEITSPSSIGGILFHMSNGINSAFFPDEKLFLFEGGKDTSDMPESIILGQITDNLNLLKQNYNATPVTEEQVFIAMNPAWVLDFIPKNGFTPRRKYWVDKDTYQVLKEERYWGSDQAPYSSAMYTTFKKQEKPVSISKLNPPDGVTKVNLSGKEKNAFLSYSSIAAAEKQEKIKIAYPGYLPQGFELKYIQVFTLFGARIQVMNFTDGLNDLLVTVRPQQNAFVTLLAGAFSLNLIKKISDLSYQAPNNYFSRGAGKNICVAFGDLSPSELEKVANSLPL
ncbi:hypothetical protein COW36_14535 [bacterium (Candidatus Blackallbacteria) CG17_big_fil_post_rev_8_21_14_2_50_48_46]|uniref:DUF4412 domain-containing protein n=1 Tax=bacterium (Candidatus Blackallbacteria) CG17_big_fil_post_rev_8_21_14_2_50_48_46 TaxID=2014261 RepID=A0A2M7G2B1_9BACT|nr:MAG: hypothetical protein COW64_12015 [bacterium (Candidatus Blackallbacteria) CG18_big_fil_WC_8_21_14_2_50_49_26]PIW15933.1 MAG: hypothetical protein COW36_14535 [bacterium (Candidatus Blackallbacteria) CG17_big_fil_post_rev_8_21_14_2_50_48_46]PIW50345.1 MAG: hypothetical protein COW20_02250 [bacterium (Candidatus Blackallbacteria) CG13_big_fil_rev_8_21_14_2_50_49_14]